ncbi:MAG: hypothetical protein ACFFGZ_12345, partial [Candidatus Thorarchaeota archaeon]
IGATSPFSAQMAIIPQIVSTNCRLDHCHMPILSLLLMSNSFGYLSDARMKSTSPYSNFDGEKQV